MSSSTDLGILRDKAQKYNNVIDGENLTTQRTTGSILTAGCSRVDVAVNFTRDVVDEITIGHLSSSHVEQVLDETALPVLELKDVSYLKAVTGSCLFKFGVDINSQYSEFTFDALSAAVEAAVFSGTGLNDATSSGTFAGTEPTEYLVEIDATGTPDTFKWSKDGGSTWEATGVSITGAAQTLDSGVEVTFAATTGHTLGDQWTIKAGYGSTTDTITVDIFLR